VSVESAPRDPDVLQSARKHGIADLDAQHAYRNALDVFEVNDDMIMYIGPARDGILLEVGTIQAVDQPDHILIAHAMRARARFLRKR
jgi:hypothetical protein